MVGRWGREGTSSVAGEEQMRRFIVVWRIEVGVMSNAITLWIVNEAAVGRVKDSMGPEWEVVAGKLLAQGYIR